VLNAPEGSITFEDNALITDYVVMSQQINHDWQLGTDIRPHFHWWQVSANMPNWLLQYRWQRNGEAKTTAWTSSAFDANAFTYTAGTLTQITSFPDIVPPTGYGLSDVIQMRLIRDSTNVSGLFAGADPEAADVDAVSMDFHKQINTVGSRQPFSK
jgi:hypothetical protein